LLSQSENSNNNVPIELIYWNVNGKFSIQELPGLTLVSGFDRNLSNFFFENGGKFNLQEYLKDTVGDY
jgi:hypothetical protein